jgi:hypothetical protein
MHDDDWRAGALAAMLCLLGRTVELMEDAGYDLETVTSGSTVNGVRTLSVETRVPLSRLGKDWSNRNGIGIGGAREGDLSVSIDPYGMSACVFAGKRGRRRMSMFCLDPAAFMALPEADRAGSFLRMAGLVGGNDGNGN